MAKQEEIYSMFGLKSPSQMRDERRARQQAYLRAQQDPYAKAGAALGVGLSRLFGKPSEEELEAQRAQEIMTDAMQAEGGQIAKMAALANRFNEAGMPKAAMAALAELDRLKQQEFDRRDEKTLRAAQLDKANIVQVPTVVGKEDVYGVDVAGNKIVIGQKDVIRDVAYDRRTMRPVIDVPAMGGSSGDVQVILDNAPTYTQVGRTRDGFPTATTDGKYYILNDDGTLGEEVQPSEIILGKPEEKPKPTGDKKPASLSAYEQGLVDMYGGAPAPAQTPTPLSVPKLTEEDKKSLGGYANYLNY